MPRKMVVPVSLQSILSKLTPLHSCCILSSVFSREYSFEAYSEISSITSMCSRSCSCSALDKLKDTSTLTGKPRSFDILFQCLSLSPGFLSAAIRGKYSWNLFKRSFRILQASAALSLKTFCTLAKARIQFSMLLVRLSGSSSVNGPSVHSGRWLVKSPQIFQRLQ